MCHPEEGKLPGQMSYADQDWPPYDSGGARARWRGDGREAFRIGLGEWIDYKVGPDPAYMSDPSPTPG